MHKEITKKKIKTQYTYVGIQILASDRHFNKIVKIAAIPTKNQQTNTQM